MLYDILIIDDDFSGQTVLDGIDLKSKTNSIESAWNQTIMPFYFGLIRENLKVTWTTGETDDLQKLDKCQLSKIKYIICDLHLSGRDPNTNNKTIISTIMSVMKKLNTNFNEKNINFLVNSKYIDEHKNIEIELKNALSKEYLEKYSVAAFSKKNAITKNQKQALLDASLLSHIKERIITKHLEVECCFNQKIDITMTESKQLSFSSKHIIFRKIFSLNNDNNKKITNLNKSRNAIAHNPINLLGNLQDISGLDSDIKEIKSFSDLFTYLEKIDTLIENITNAEAIN